MTRQAENQRDLVRRGLCRQACGRARTYGRSLCDQCREKKRLYMRAKKGCRPWRPGHRGRPPIGAKKP